MKTYPTRRVDPKPGWIPEHPRKSKACANEQHCKCTMASCTCDCQHGLNAKGESTRLRRLTLKRGTVVGNLPTG